MSTVLKTIFESVAGLLVSLLLAAGVWAVKKLADYLHAKASSSRLFGALAALDDLVLSAVTSVENTLKPQLTSFQADGKLTPEEAKQLKDAAIAAVKATLGTEGWATLQKLLSILVGGSIDDLLAQKVEVAVTKVAQNAALSAAPAVVATASPG